MLARLQDPRSDGAVSGAMQPSRSRRGEVMRCGAVALLFAAAFIAPALWNGGALLRFDSAGYALDARTLRFFEARPMGYALFLRPFLASGTSGPALFAQSFFTSLLALRAGMSLVPGARHSLALASAALGAALLFSPLAAHASTLMPDVFTSWLLLGGALVLLAARRGDLWLGGVAWLVSLCVHSTHLPVALAMLVIAFAATARGPLAQPALRRRLALLAGLVPVALATQAAVARAVGFAGPLFGHPAFLVSRQHTMGVLVDTLDRRCGERAWKLCVYRDTIASHPSDDAAWLLWYRESPFGRIGRFTARSELGEIAWEGLRAHWPLIVTETLRGAVQQFFQVETSTELDSRPARGYAQALRHELPEESARAAASRQASGRPVLASLFAPHEDALHAALVLACALVAAVCAWRGRARAALFLAATLVFLAIHALVVSFGTSPLGRYQGRIAGLVPFALALGVASLVGRSGDARAQDSARRSDSLP